MRVGQCVHNVIGRRNACLSVHTCFHYFPRIQLLSAPCVSSNDSYCFISTSTGWGRDKVRIIVVYCTSIVHTMRTEVGVSR